MAERKKQYEVIWTNTAKRQFLYVLEYWIEHNKSSAYSEKIHRKTFQKISFLKESPESFQQTELDNIHKTQVEHFAVVYQIKSSTIHILAFWDQRQNPKKLLTILKRKRA